MPHAKPSVETRLVTRDQLEPSPLEHLPRPGETALVAIDNAPAEEINALSTSELAPLLNSANRRIRVSVFIQVISILLFTAAVIQANDTWIFITVLYAAIFVPAAIFLDRYSRSVKVVYEPGGALGQIAEALNDSFQDLVACRSAWRIQAQGRTSDWKRNAGASVLSKRRPIQPQFSRPTCIRSDALFPALKLGGDEIYLLPDAALIIAKGSVAAVGYHEFFISNSRTRFIEEEGVPSDSPIVDETWRYVNKKGGPDRRFNANRRIPICIYGELSFRSDGGLNSVIQYSNPAAADRLCSVLDVLHRTTAHFPKSFVYIKVAKKWPTVLLLIFAAILGATQLVFFSDVLHASLRGSAQKSIAPAPAPISSVVTKPPESRSENSPQLSKPLVAPVSIQSSGKDIEAGPRSSTVGIPLPRPRPKF